MRHLLETKVYSIHSIFAQVGRLTNLFRAFAGKVSYEEKFLKRQKLMFPGKIFGTYETEKYFPLEAHREIYKFLKSVWMKEAAVIIHKKMFEFKDNISFIKTRLTERYIMNRSKVEMFLIRWDQLVFQII